MNNLFRLSASIKEKISNPVNVLSNLPSLENPRVILKKDILSVSKISKYLYVLYCPDVIYVSTVFNKEFHFEESEYEKIVLKKCYDSIYYDIMTSF